MKALFFAGPRQIEYQTVDDPKLEDAASAIVKVEVCAICGSDLHLYAGHMPMRGFCVGHECVGEVVEVGSRVERFRVGDRVIVSALVGCASCGACWAGRTDLCERSRTRVYGMGPDLQGTQAEAALAPAADTTLLHLPAGMDPETAVLLTDNLPTAYYAAERAGIGTGASVAVLGLGPVGQLAIDCAFLLGAARVFGVDPVPERLEIARASGATALPPAGAVEQVRDATAGRGVDAVIDAAGVDATLSLALELVRMAGTLSIVAVPQDAEIGLKLLQAMGKSLTLRIGLCPVQSYWRALIPLVETGRLRPERVITHRVALADGAEAYRRFDAREDGVMKTVLRP